MTRQTTEFIEPSGWARPRGYSNGVLAPAGARMLFVAGQVGWKSDQTLVSPDFVPQFGQALSNILEVVETAGGKPGDICNLTIFVADKAVYEEHMRDVGAVYREVLGKHFPAMALIEVSDFLAEGALVEIQAIAAVSS